MLCFSFFTNKTPLKCTARHALVRVFGVGLGRASHVCDLLGLAKDYKFSQLTKYKLGILVALIKRFYGVDLLLRRFRLNRLKAYLSIKSYNSIRLRSGLPIRGQGTHTNARTAKSRDLQSALRSELRKDIA